MLRLIQFICNFYMWAGKIDHMLVVPVAQRLMAAHRAPCAVACGTERKPHSLLGPGQNVGSRAHAPVLPMPAGIV
jgi:hypothetical protein